MTDSAQAVTVSIDATALGFSPARVKVVDMLTGGGPLKTEKGEAGRLSVRPTVPARTTVVLSVK